MPIRVTLRVKRASPLVHERYPISKKQRTNDLRGVRITNASSTACDSGSGRALLCEPSYDPHLLQKTSTSTSNQKTSQVGTADHAEVRSFNSSSIETGLDIDSLSNQDSEMNNGFSEFQREEDFENNQQVAPSYSAHGPAAVPFVLNKNQKKKYPSWDERFKELVDFKKINGHTHVPQQLGPLGRWVHDQRSRHQYLLKEGKYSSLTIDRREKLESIGFSFILRPPSHWDQRLQDLLDFKKIYGHTNVPKRDGPLGQWVSRQRTQCRLFKEGKKSHLTVDRREKLESIGFAFIHQPP
eukprot:scaffold422966_cov52-Attheya_sp.AAC.1